MFILFPMQLYDRNEFWNYRNTRYYTIKVPLLAATNYPLAFKAVGFLQSSCDSSMIRKGELHCCVSCLPFAAYMCIVLRKCTCLYPYHCGTPDGRSISMQRKYCQLKRGPYKEKLWQLVDCWCFYFVIDRHRTKASLHYTNFNYEIRIRQYCMS